MMATDITIAIIAKALAHLALRVPLNKRSIS